MSLSDPRPAAFLAEGTASGGVSPGTEPDSSTESHEEEPVTTGTLFIMLLFLMALGGMWFLMYLVLLER